MNKILIAGWIAWVITGLFNLYLIIATADLVGVTYIILYGSSVSILLMAFEYLRGEMRKCQTKK